MDWINEVIRSVSELDYNSPEGQPGVMLVTADELRAILLERAPQLAQKTAFSEQDCLKVNPFEGDFGSPGDRVLKDKISTARKAGTCGMCRKEIEPGEKVRTLAAVFDGVLMNYRWCSLCCSAMAASWTDNGEAWEVQARLGREQLNTPINGERSESAA